MTISPMSARQLARFTASGTGRSPLRRPRWMRPPRDLGPPEPSPLRPRVVEAVRDRVRSGRYRPPAEDVADRLVALARSGRTLGPAPVEP